MMNERDLKTLISIAVAALESAMETDGIASRGIVRTMEEGSGRTAAELIRIGKHIMESDAMVVHMHVERPH